MVARSFLSSCGEDSDSSTFGEVDMTRDVLMPTPVFDIWVVCWAPVSDFRVGTLRDEQHDTKALLLDD